MTRLVVAKHFWRDDPPEAGRQPAPGRVSGASARRSLSFYTRSGDDDGPLSRLVRPDHLRPPRRHRPCRDRLRPARRRRPGQPQEVAARLARRSHRRSSARRSREELPDVASRIDVAGFDGLTVDFARTDRCRLHRPWPACRERLRVGAPDGAHESEARAAGRHGLLHDRARARLPVVEPGQGDRRFSAATSA